MNISASSHSISTPVAVRSDTENPIVSEKDVNLSKPPLNQEVSDSVNIPRQSKAIGSVEFLDELKELDSSILRFNELAHNSSFFSDNSEFFKDLKNSHCFYTNGIQTEEIKASDDRSVLYSSVSAYLGPMNEEFKTRIVPVELHYNPTEKDSKNSIKSLPIISAIADTVEANKNLLGKETPIATSLAEKVKAKVDSGQPVYLFGHSQGGAISLDAMRQVEKMYQTEGLSDSELSKKMSQIKFVGFGAYVHPDLFPKDSQILLNKHPEDNVPKMAEALAEAKASLPLALIPNNTARSIFAKKSFGLVKAAGNMVGDNISQALSYGSQTAKNTPPMFKVAAFTIGTFKGFGVAISDHASTTYSTKVGQSNGGNMGYLGNMILSPTPNDAQSTHYLVGGHKM